MNIRTVSKAMSIITLSKATLGKPKRDGVERRDNHQLDKDDIGKPFERWGVHLVGGWGFLFFSKHIDTILN